MVYTSYSVLCRGFKNEKCKKIWPSRAGIWTLLFRIISPALIWIFTEGEGEKVKSRQLSKRDFTVYVHFECCALTLCSGLLQNADMEVLSSKMDTASSLPPPPTYTLNGGTSGTPGTGSSVANSPSPARAQVSHSVSPGSTSGEWKGWFTFIVLRIYLIFFFFSFDHFVIMGWKIF